MAIWLNLARSSAPRRGAAQARARTGRESRRRIPSIWGVPAGGQTGKPRPSFALRLRAAASHLYLPSIMAKQTQATWGGRFESGPAALMLKFSESASIDRRLAPYDVAGSKAHCAMLAHVGLITAKECRAICEGLDAVLADMASGRFHWDERLEDVHMNIEHALTSRVPAAAKLHTARSRHDQVATDMRLFLKDACGSLSARIRAAQQSLLAVASANRAILIPGYTHLQRAQPVAAAHHLLAWMEMLQRDRERLGEVAGKANECPLGSGAIAGTTLPIDREFAAKLLGFVDAKGNARVTQNSMDAVADRDLFIEFASACALFGV